MVKKALLILALVGMTVPIMACNTTKGAGQDMKAAGQSVENAAKNNGAQ